MASIAVSLSNGGGGVGGGGRSAGRRLATSHSTATPPPPPPPLSLPKQQQQQQQQASGLRAHSTALEMFKSKTSSGKRVSKQIRSEIELLRKIILEKDAHIVQ